jgi:uncharacterized DUF497 family protein
LFANLFGKKWPAVVVSATVATKRYGDFEWDEKKAQTNHRKHGVSFEEAITTFADPMAVDAPDRYMPGRFVLIGNSLRGRILFVIYEERRDNIRLISTRRASPTQRRKYEEGVDAS